MAEYVRVIYPVSRDVFVDGVRNGRTNQIIYVDSGTYAFDLGPDKDYKPESAIRQVSGTTTIRPLEIVFEPKLGEKR